MWLWIRQTGSQLPTYKSWRCTRWALQFWDMLFNQTRSIKYTRLVAKNQVLVSFPDSPPLGTISIPNSTLGNSKRSGIICTLPIIQESTIPTCYLSLYFFCGDFVLVGTPGNYKQAKQLDALAKGQQEAEWLYLPCVVSQVCLRGHHGQVCPPASGW